MTKRERSLSGDVEPGTDSSNNDTRTRRSKRSKTASSAEPGEALEAISGTGYETASDSPDEQNHKFARRTFSHISVCGPAFPRSHYEGWTPPLTPTTENEALPALRRAFDSQRSPAEGKPEYATFKLDDFCIYRPEHKSHAFQLSSLDRLKNRGGFDEFLFDGVLSFGSQRYFVQGVRFGSLAIDGYGDPDVVDLSDRICIQSPAAKAKGAWYQLGRPSQEYRRFFDPFLWLAQFAKYFVDYLLANDDVTLCDFRRAFHGRLFTRYSDRGSFQSWLDVCKLRDFRATVAVHVGFLWKECHSIHDDETNLLGHRIWSEVDPMKLSAIKRQPQVETQTIVTPFVFDCFKHMYFAGHMEQRDISDSSVLDAVAQRKRDLKLTPFKTGDGQSSALLTPKSMPETSEHALLNFSEGDVVCIQPDTLSRWKTVSSTWYAYVHGVHSDTITTKLDVIWLYEPQDTTLGQAYYPFSNELFFSDNCACGKSAIDTKFVTAKADVKFFVQDPTSINGLFVRQKFRTVHDEDTYDFVALKRSDLKCNCANKAPIFDECRSKFQIGDTVLYREYNVDVKEDILEAGQIVDFLLPTKQVQLRRLQRKSETHPTARPNELVETEEMLKKPATKVIRHFHVRYFHPDVLQEGLPNPYNQNGSGDFYFIVSADGAIVNQTRESSDRDTADCVTRTSNPLPLEEGWDPEASPPANKLKGMGIFCGGGNFDRGLEDGGAVEFEFAIDYAEHALHTYLANARNPESLKPFLGSVDDALAQAMAGSTLPVIAKVGEFEVLAAGSPCPGFSRANIRKLDFRALRNSSMVASVASYVDFYSPSYCLLENVIPITEGMGPNKDENVFAQILATFVALGYQTQQHLMESWSFGSSQSRGRVFIVATAPGLEPLPPPPYTHAQPRTGARWRNTKLGQSSNGLPFGIRRDVFTPFEHVSPWEATRDLPDVGDSLPQICPRFPDHRTPSDRDNLALSCIAVVPNHPRGMGFVDAIKEGNSTLEIEHPLCSSITGPPLDFYEAKLKQNKNRDRKGSKVYSRVYPGRLFPTVMTTMHTNDAFNGRSLHWDQARTLTVMDVRRAQGFQDDEVIIGSTAQQMKILGNSVDRKVALAFGLSLRYSWLKNSLGRS